MTKKKSPPPVPSELCRYSAARRLMTAEASTISEYYKNPLEPVRVRSKETGRVVSFEFERAREDDEGEVASRVYYNRDLDVRLEIYND